MLNVKMEECPKQSGVKDCGAFTIANATLLAVGGNPSTHAFNQHCMRMHLLKGFEDFASPHSPQHNLYNLTIITDNHVSIFSFYMYTYTTV